MILKYSGTSTISVDVADQKTVTVYPGNLVMCAEEEGKNLLSLYGDLFEVANGNEAAQVEKVEVTSAELLASNTTPVTLLSAPGAGKYLVVDSITGFVDFNSAAYDTNTTLEFRYTDESGAKVATDSAVLLPSTADTVVNVGGVEAEVTAVANAPVVLATATGDPANGDSPMTFFVKYRVVSL